jgi:hypothetical protein
VEFPSVLLTVAIKTFLAKAKAYGFTSCWKEVVIHEKLWNAREIF